MMRLLLLSLSIWLTGCSISQGPDVLLISPSDYGKAFDAAVAVAKEDGLQPSMLDRRKGIIATAPVVAGSAFEPWKPRPSSPRQGLDSTLSLQRRTARFEFRPVKAGVVPSDRSGDLRGPNLLSNSGVDLTQQAEQLELRVWVYVDRHYSQGVRRGTWTLKSETASTESPTEGDWKQVRNRFWVPVTRDVARERALLSRIESRLIGE